MKANLPPTRSKGRLTPTQILVTAIVCAVVIIGVVVILTPMEEMTPEEYLAEQQGAALAPSSSNADSPEPVDEFGGLATLPQIPKATVRLPATPETIDVALLKTELVQRGAELLEQFPNEFLCLHMNARLHAELKQTEEAKRLWLKCLELDPKAEGAACGLAKLYMDSGEHSLATDVLKQLAASETPHSSDWYRFLGMSYENQGKIEDALETLLEGAQRYGNAADLLTVLGRVQTQVGRFSDAEMTLKRAIELDGPKEGNLQPLITALVRQGKRDFASDIQKELKAIKAAETSARTETAAQETEAGFQELYDESLRKIAVSFYLTASVIGHQHQLPSLTQQMLERALQLAPDSLEALLGLGDLYRAQNKLEDAKVIYRRVLAEQPENFINYINLSTLAIQTDDLLLAESTLRAALAIDPNGFVAQSSLAKVCLSMGKFADARKLAADVVQRNPSVDAYFLLAATYDASGDAQSAKLCFEKARDINPQDPRVIGMFGPPAASSSTAVPLRNSPESSPR
ncbi:MAG: tetratricopeptide repeat protein [Planctomycetales bacterium]|nr:tetratricopeptide repeat protein [Planctomycetales bacterium]